MSESQETRTAVLEANYKTMDKKLDGILERFDTFEEKLDIALAKKAGVWTEKAIIGFIIFVLTGLGGYLGSLIYKTIIHIN